jgi:colicin import membrane protein
MEIIKVNPEEYGIEAKKASELTGNLPQIKSERDILSQRYEEVVKMDIENPETAKIARELRLKIRDNRTKGIDVWHKTTKDFFLKGGQFVDAIKRVEIAVNQRMEENLESIEKYFENKEKERKAKLNEERLSILEPYSEFVPFGINFGEISEEEFTKILNGSKLQLEAKLEEERKVEEERLRIEKITKLHYERKEQLLPLWQFLDDTTINFGELSEELFASIKSVANAKKVDYEAEQERIRVENEKLAAEKAELEAKAKKEREEKAALEAELQAKKEAEAKALKEAAEKAEKELIEAEKLAKAPIKKQMSVWVNSFELPTTEIQNEKVDLIKQKFEAFKNWSLKEIEGL